MTSHAVQLFCFNMAESETEISESELYCSSCSVTDVSDSDSECSDTGALPYQFEPVVPQRRREELENDSSDPEPDDERLFNTNWCSCNQCRSMPTERECRCCHEVEAVARKVDEFNLEKETELGCITQHPGFRTVCLDEYVLETAYFQYRQQYGDANVGSINEKNRYVAYRQLARWCWGFLGKEVRVVLPSCAVNLIRDTYPSDVYKGFLDA